MRPTALHEHLRSGGVATSAWISSDSTYAAEVLGHAGYDTATVDCQHGMFDLGGAIRLLQVLGGTPAVPMARTPSHDPAIIGKLLDAGAWGIICPSVDTASQARDFVASCRYPPGGRRSYGPARGLLVGGHDYADVANDLVLTWAMVESAAGLENLDEILAVDGLHGIYVGPNDLALSLGASPGLDQPLLDVLADIAQRVRAAGRLAGVFCGDIDLAHELVNMGYNLITPGNDVQLLRFAANAHLRAVEGGAGEGRGERGRRHDRQEG